MISPLTVLAEDSGVEGEFVAGGGEGGGLGAEAQGRSGAEKQCEEGEQLVAHQGTEVGVWSLRAPRGRGFADLPLSLKGEGVGG